MPIEHSGSTEVYRPPGWQDVADLFAGLRFDGGANVLHWSTERAAMLLSGWELGYPGVVTIVSNWHPELTGRADEVLAWSPSLGDARITVARELGFADWSAVERLGWRTLDPVFETAVDLMLRGDLAGLLARIEADPTLPSKRSGFGHRAGLLHYLAANGVETERQVVPGNGPALIETLLGAGADPAATMAVYGGRFTTLQLLETSAHPRAAGLAEAMAAALR